ncbi:MAG: hypothetical protein ABIQ74_05670 [Chitinophagales bacterium]
MKSVFNPEKFSRLIIALYPSDSTFYAGASVLKRSIGKEVASPVNWSVNPSVIPGKSSLPPATSIWLQHQLPG